MGVLHPELPPTAPEGLFRDPSVLQDILAEADAPAPDPDFSSSYPSEQVLLRDLLDWGDFPFSLEVRGLAPSPSSRPSQKACMGPE